MTGANRADPLTPVPVGIGGKIGLVARIWYLAARIQLGLARHPVGTVARELGRRSGRPRQSIGFLNRASDRALRIGRHQPRCLTRSLVLYALLREQGDPAELVIGLPLKASSADAHAWVELDGVDVGPLPGRQGYEVMARYPRSAVSSPHLAAASFDDADEIA